MSFNLEKVHYGQLYQMQQTGPEEQIVLNRLHDTHTHTFIYSQPYPADFINWFQKPWRNPVFDLNVMPSDVNILLYKHFVYVFNVFLMCLIFFIFFIFHSSPLLGHRPLTKVFQSQSFVLFFFSPAVTFSTCFLGVLPFLFPCGFNVRACLVIVNADFQSVWPNRPHRLLPISSPAFRWSNESENM